MTRASGGYLARTPELHPYTLREVPWDFNDHREPGPRFNISFERREYERGFFLVDTDTKFNKQLLANSDTNNDAGLLHKLGLKNGKKCDRFTPSRICI